MEHPEIPGFVTKAVACERYDVSDRTLGRQIKKAMMRKDEEVLENWKLVTVDSQIIPGSDVTFQLIDDLQNQALIPTWNIATKWLLKEFGEDAGPKTPSETAADQDGGDLSPPIATQPGAASTARDDKIEELYERNIAQLEKQVSDLKVELKIAHANLSAEKKTALRREKNETKLIAIIFKAGLQGQLQSGNESDHDPTDRADKPPQATPEPTDAGVVDVALVDSVKGTSDNPPEAGETSGTSSGSAPRAQKKRRRRSSPAKQSKRKQATKRTTQSKTKPRPSPPPAPKSILHRPVSDVVADLLSRLRK